MRPVNIVWWRFGKEHDPGGSTFRVNPAEMVAEHLHVARVYHDAARDCWIKQDLFADIVTDAGCRECLVVDLDDLATAMDIGLVTPAETAQILRQTQAATNAISRGEFPFPEIGRGGRRGGLWGGIHHKGTKTQSITKGES